MLEQGFVADVLCPGQDARVEVLGWDVRGPLPAADQGPAAQRPLLSPSGRKPLPGTGRMCA
jgi:hypothetical protein